MRVGFKQQWCVAFRRRAGSERALDPAAHSFTFLEPGKDRYHADPFLIERGGRTYLFFEEFKGELGRGTIAYVEIHDDGTYSAPRTALERPAA